ncbi:methyltransferase [Kitasatospora sp. NPDC089509]|uniref:methyltransferase n=1 Tax=Kitasatospora sp. NPDC089509 TaxID=3364079 RepID=UPI0038041E21
MSEPTAAVNQARLLEMMTAFKSTYLLRAAIRLRVFDALAVAPCDPDDVAAILRTNPRATRILLRALTAAGLLRMEGEQFTLPEGVRELLVTTSPQYCGGIAEVAASDWEWDALRDLDEVVRHGSSRMERNAESADFPYWVDFATHLTFATRPGAQFLAESTVAWAKARGSLDVLDVGCGHGLFGFAIAEGDPRAQVTCLDWPDVLDVARRHADRLGVGERVRYLPGDAFAVDLDGEYDVIVLGNFLFQFPVRRCIELVRRLAGRLKPGGRVVIAGFTTGDRPPAQDYHAHLLNLLMLAWTTQGELHSPDMYRKILAAAGLGGVEVAERPGLPFRFITGESV